MSHLFLLRPPPSGKRSLPLSQSVSPNLRLSVSNNVGRSSVLMGVGLIILANSRPFEGFLAGLPVAAATLAAVQCHRCLGWDRVWRIVLPLTAVLAIGFLWIGYYNLRTTGHALLRPYDLHASLYAASPVSLLQTARREPEYRNDRIRRYQVSFIRPKFASQLTLEGYVKAIKQKSFILWSFYLGVLLSVPLISLPWALGDEWSQFAILTCGVVLWALCWMPWFQVHYLAPIAPLFVLLEVRCLRVLWLTRWRGRAFWQSLATGVPLALIITMPVSAAIWSGAYPSQQWFVQRQQLLEQLTQQSGKHLVVVRYSPSYSVHDEWVYNEADFDTTRVVWAHYMDPRRNEQLLQYFRDRKPWLLEVGLNNFEIKPYPRSNSSSQQPSRNGTNDEEA